MKCEIKIWKNPTLTAALDQKLNCNDKHDEEGYWEMSWENLHPPEEL